ncbi:MAG: 50S ribosomal protein L23 [Bacteroidetes bacterium]|nr:MAG: 50S ribosomal protein L23 [Bacteroidota bacterium]
MNILLKPIISEKMTTESEKYNRYGFVVRKMTNKTQIKRAIEQMYNVHVSSINTMIYGGKTKSRFTKAGAITGKTSSYKKAIVTLVEGDKIDFYSNI